jgi:hypothetical protein
VTAPNGGETWQTNSSHSITWTSTGTVGNVKIEYSTNNGSSWSTITSSTANDGVYSWTVPETPSSLCKVRISEASDGSPSDTSNAVFSIIEPVPPQIALNRTHFNFGGIIGGAVTGSQPLRVDNSGGNILQWTATPSTSRLSCSPASGTNAGVISVSVNIAGLATGTYSGTITVSDPDATNSPQTVTVDLTVKNSFQDEAPFGTFETPTHGSTVRSSVPVTGWVLDDVAVASVKIYRNQNSSLVYIGDAIMVDGARPDVEQLYPDYPASYQAGWGYMMLTNFLPNGGNGTFELTAVATDLSGWQTTLGSKTVTVNNADAVKPFGAIDLPEPGGTASGTDFRNSGWVLTPLPNKIPEDGSTINVYIDGVNKGQPVYNIYRPDIASLFPGYANSDGAHAYFNFDTTAYSNGIHTIAWTAADNGGNSDGIGSRYFTIQNSGGNRRHGAWSMGQGGGVPGLYSPDPGPVGIIKGYEKNIEPEKIVPDDSGIIDIEIKELERLEIHFFDSMLNISSLPVGSTLDVERGVFYWQLGPGVTGLHELEFINPHRNQIRRINVKIMPRY